MEIFQHFFSFAKLCLCLLDIKTTKCLCVGKRFHSLASLLSLINTIPTPLAKICDQDLGEFDPGHVVSTAGRDNWFALIPSQCIVPL